MARSQLPKYAVVAGGLFLAYQMALRGALGNDMRGIAGDLRGLFGTTGRLALGADGSSGAGSVTPGLMGSGVSSGDPLLDAIVRANPNFIAQMHEWQGLRQVRGEYPYDWGAFRQHLNRIGAPDPGLTPPRAFTGG